MTTSVRGEPSLSNGHRGGRDLRAELPPRSSERLPLARRPRRPLALRAGVLLVLGSAAIGGALALQSSNPSTVLVLARPVAAGQVLGRDDVTIAHVSGSGLHGIAASSLDAVVGETAQSNLPAGTMLTGPMLTTIAVPGAGQQIVAVALKEGAFPPELMAGRAVSVMQVPAAGSTGGTSAVLVPSARVLGLAPDASTGVTVISLLVDNAHALAVSQASALGAVSLSVLPVAP